MTDDKRSESIEEEGSTENGSAIDYIFIGIAILAGLIAVFFYVINFAGNKVSPEGFGQFGDYIGGILNPFIALLALLCLIRSLRLQREEFRKFSAEQKRLREIQSKQSKQERFKGDIEQHQYALAALNCMVHTSRAEKLEGRYALLCLSKEKCHYEENDAQGKIFYKLLTKYLYEKKKGSTKNDIYTLNNEFVREKALWLKLEAPISAEKNMTNFKKAYENLLSVSGLDLTFYFRLMYSFLKNAKESYEDEHYDNIHSFRAKLSENELVFITLNALFSSVGKKTRRYIKEYGLLKHLPRSYFNLYELVIREFSPEFDGDLPAIYAFGRGYAKTASNVAEWEEIINSQQLKVEEVEKCSPII